MERSPRKPTYTPGPQPRYDHLTGRRLATARQKVCPMCRWRLVPADHSGVCWTCENRIRAYREETR